MKPQYCFTNCLVGENSKESQFSTKVSPLFSLKKPLRLPMRIVDGEKTIKLKSPIKEMRVLPIQYSGSVDQLVEKNLLHVLSYLAGMIVSDDRLKDKDSYDNTFKDLKNHYHSPIWGK